MHSKNNNKTKTFIQGLRPFSSSIPKTLKKHLRKGGYNYSNIVDNWTKMVSKKISDACYPIAVKIGKEMKDGTLVLKVTHGKEMEVEYEKREIMDKINSFFGYNCISQIKLKIIHEKKKLKKKIHQKIIGEEEINSKISSVQDKSLKKSLNNLINAFKEKHD